MQYLLLEEPLYLLAFLGFVEIVLWIVYRKDLSPCNLKKLAIAPGVGVFIFLLSTFVTTERENIINICETSAREVEKNNLDVLNTLVDDNFKGILGSNTIDKKYFIDKLKEATQTVKINGVKFNSFNIVTKETSATMKVNTIIFLTATEGMFQLPLTWDIEWVKTNDTWKIITAKEPKYMDKLMNQ